MYIQAMLCCTLNSNAPSQSPPSSSPSDKPSTTPTANPSTTPSADPSIPPTENPSAAPIYSIAICPFGTEQIGGPGADIWGCGLTECEDRYDLYTIEECYDKCIGHPECHSLSFAYPGQEPWHPDQTVCTIYNGTNSTGTWGDEQVFCRIISTSEPTMNPSAIPSNDPTTTTRTTDVLSDYPTNSPSNRPSVSPENKGDGQIVNDDTTESPDLQTGSTSPSQESGWDGIFGNILFDALFAVVMGLFLIVCCLSVIIYCIWRKHQIERELDTTAMINTRAPERVQSISMQSVASPSIPSIQSEDMGMRSSPARSKVASVMSGMSVIDSHIENMMETPMDHIICNPNSIVEGAGAKMETDHGMGLLDAISTPQHDENNLDILSEKYSQDNKNEEMYCDTEANEEQSSDSESDEGIYTEHVTNGAVETPGIHITKDVNTSH